MSVVLSVIVLSEWDRVLHLTRGLRQVGSYFNMTCISWRPPPMRENNNWIGPPRCSLVHFYYTLRIMVFLQWVSSLSTGFPFSFQEITSSKDSHDFSGYGIDCQDANPSLEPHIDLLVPCLRKGMLEICNDKDVNRMFRYSWWFRHLFLYKCRFWLCNRKNFSFWVCRNLRYLHENFI